MIHSILKHALFIVGLLFSSQLLNAQEVIIGDASGFDLTINGTVDINANLINNSPNTAFTGTVNFLGDIPYEISGAAPIKFANLIISNTAGISLLTDITVNTELNLLSGTLNLVDNSLTVGGVAIISGSFSPTTMIIADGAGSLKREITSIGTYIFPIGDTTGLVDYSPVSLDFSSGTFTDAVVSINLKNEKHPENTSVNDYLNKYWVVSQDGITGFSCDAIFTYSNEDIIGDESNIWGAKWDGSQWTTLNQASLNQFNGTVTDFSEFTAGEKTISSINDEYLSPDDIDIIVDNNHLIIRSNNHNLKLERAEIYSILGQMIYSQDLNNSVNELDFNANSDYYIVKVYTKDQFISKKIFKN